jgi:hypothetical protein
LPDKSAFAIEEHLAVPLLIRGKGRTEQKYDEIRATFACHFNKAGPNATNLRKIHKNIPN